MNIPFISDKKSKENITPRSKNSSKIYKETGKTEEFKFKNFRDIVLLRLQAKQENPYSLFALNELIKQIDMQGRAVVALPTYENFTKYKNLVSAFINKAIEAYQVKEEVIKKDKYCHKVYLIIEEIDKKLSELAKSILNSQIEAISLLAKINEIKGLLLDMFI